MTRRHAAPVRGGTSRLPYFAPLLVVIVSGLGAAGCQSINIRLAMNQGVTHFKSKEFELAAESFKQAIRLNPKYPEAYLDLGLTYMELYEPGSTHPKDLQYADGAIESFKRYIRLEPENLKVKDYLINVCSTSGRMDEAINFFMEDYDRNPDDLTIVRMIAALYHRAGDTQKAIEWFTKAANLDTGNAEAWYSVGVSCWGHSYNTPFMEYEDRMAVIEQGLEALKKAESIRNNYFEALTYESLLLREKSKYDISPAQAVQWRQEADQLLQKALQLRNASLAAQAKEAAGTPGDGSTAPSTPAATGGDGAGHEGETMTGENPGEDSATEETSPESDDGGGDPATPDTATDPPSGDAG